MNEIERALSEISDIRSRLAASTRFRGYAPEAVAMIGFLSLVIVLAQMFWPDTLAASNEQQVLILAAVLVASGLTIATEAITRARSQHGGMAGAMLKGMVRAQLPICLVGATVGIVLFLHERELVWILPGLWQMLVGVVSFNSYSTMPRAIIWPALWFVISGAAVMWLAGKDGQLTPLLVGGPFTVGYLSIAWILHREGAQTA